MFFYLFSFLVAAAAVLMAVMSPTFAVITAAVLIVAVMAMNIAKLRPVMVIVAAALAFAIVTSVTRGEAETSIMLAVMLLVQVRATVRTWKKKDKAIATKAVAAK